jgi:hypothetical protein
MAPLPLPNRSDTGSARKLYFTEATSPVIAAIIEVT